MSNRPERRGADAGPSQRQLRVAEEIRHALSAVLIRGDVRDPELAEARVTVTEVRASPDLKHMTVFVSRLGKTADTSLLAALKRSQPWLRTQVAKAVRLRVAPELHFQPDTALDHAMHIDALMRRPEVARDLSAGNGAKAGAEPDTADDPDDGNENAARTHEDDAS